MADHDTHDHTGIPGVGGSSDLDAIIAASAGQDIADALSGAAAPDAGNVFATIADVGGGGGMVLLEQHDAAGGVSALEFVSFISSTYDTYVFKGVNIVPATNAASLSMQVGSGGGPTWDTGSNYYGSVNGIASNTNAIGFQVNPSPGYAIAGPIANNALYGHTSFSLDFLAPQNSDYKTIHGTCSWHNGTSVGSGNLGGLYVITTALTAARFLFSSGNIASGIIRVYGIVK